jgi:uncharacterized Ntn-hydrolase superfamily protein
MVSQKRGMFPVHTYSIVARDPETGELGVAVQSHAFSVGSLVTWAEAGVGAVATQSLVRVEYGPEGLALMRVGLTADQALQTLTANDEGREVRQIAMIDAEGHVAVHTGSKCIPTAGHIVGDNYSVQANLMINDKICTAMQTAYENATGELATRLIAALEAAQAAGGDIRGQESAALLVVAGEREEQPWRGRIYDLRVEDHPHPVEELRRLYHFRRAYLLLERVEERLKEKQFEEARSLTAEAFRLVPKFVEMRFWLAVALFMAGQEDEAQGYFHEVFTQEPIWLEILPGLVPSGMLPDNPAALKRIASWA